MKWDGGVGKGPWAGTRTQGLLRRIGTICWLTFHYSCLKLFIIFFVIFLNIVVWQVRLVSMLSQSSQVISNTTKCSLSGYVKTFWTPFSVVLFHMDHLEWMLISGLTTNFVKNLTDNGRKWRHPIAYATPRLAFLDGSEIDRHLCVSMDNEAVPKTNIHQRETDRYQERKRAREGWESAEAIFNLARWPLHADQSHL